MTEKSGAGWKIISVGRVTSWVIAAISTSLSSIYIATRLDPLLMFISRNETTVAIVLCVVCILVTMTCATIALTTAGVPW